MAYRELQDADFVGKTIKSVDFTSSDNVLVLYYTDGTTTELWTEHLGFGVYGFMVDDHLPTGDARGEWSVWDDNV